MAHVFVPGSKQIQESVGLGADEPDRTPLPPLDDSLPPFVFPLPLCLAAFELVSRHEEPEHEGDREAFERSAVAAAALAVFAIRISSARSIDRVLVKEGCGVDMEMKEATCDIHGLRPRRMLRTR